MISSATFRGKSEKSKKGKGSLADDLGTKKLYHSFFFDSRAFEKILKKLYFVLCKQAQGLHHSMERRDGAEVMPASFVSETEGFESREGEENSRIKELTVEQRKKSATKLGSAINALKRSETFQSNSMDKREPGMQRNANKSP